MNILIDYWHEHPMVFYGRLSGTDKDRLVFNAIKGQIRAKRIHFKKYTMLDASFIEYEPCNNGNHKEDIAKTPDRDVSSATNNHKNFFEYKS